MPITKEEAVREIQVAIYAVVGEEWAAEMEITAETNLSEGIELDSIEISKVIEFMFKKYPGVDFESWFSSMDIEKIVALTIGDIAGFIAVESLKEGTKESTPA